MAKVIISASTNMFETKVWFGSVFSYSSSHITIGTGSSRGTYSGSFTFDAIGNVYGTLNAYIGSANGHETFSVTDINRDAHSAFTAVQSGSIDAVYRLVLSGDDYIRGSTGNDVLFSFGGNDKIMGGIGLDKLLGNLGDDSLKGGKGNDKLFGEQDNDKLFGGQGRDNLFGGQGRDFLFGEKGNDRLAGGGQGDNFVFKVGGGKDLIVDFQDDIDTIRLDKDLWSGKLSFKKLVNKFAQVDGDDTVFDFGDEEIRIKDFTDLAELRDDLVFI